MPNEITNATLDLEGIVVLAASIGDDQIELVVESRHDAGCCPYCGRAALEPKERPEVVVRDLPISGRPTMLVWRKRRWRCTACGRSFTESHPQIPPRARLTVRFKVHLASRAKAEGNFAQVARSEGVAYDTVARAYRVRAELIRAARPRPSPTVLAIDEAAFKKGQDYNTVVSDLGARYVLETLRGRDGDWLAVFLLQLDDVVKDGIRAVVMDLWEPYHKVVGALLPDAARIADKFHVIRHANRSLDDVRRRNQGRGRKTGAKRVLFSCRFALLRAVERSRPGDHERRARVFAIAPELQTAWRLKEQLRAVYEERGRRAGGAALRRWYRAVELAGIPEFSKLARMIRSSEPEILNYFTYRLTNAFAEGVTNRIKVVKRQAYGMRNFDNFKDRVLVQCGVPKPRRNPRLIA
ncbi:MAG: ISL3 family transposase [Thermoleophilaceae bacterium]